MPQPTAAPLTAATTGTSVRSRAPAAGVSCGSRLPLGAAATAVLLREGVAVVSGRVRPPAHLGEELLPRLVRQAAPLPVGARILAPVVEEAVVVVLGLQRRDLGLDERVDVVERLLDLRRDVEVHRLSFPLVATRHLAERSLS